MLNDLHSRQALFAVEKGSVIEDLNASEELTEAGKVRPLLIILPVLALGVACLIYLYPSISFDSFFQAANSIIPMSMKEETRNENDAASRAYGLPYDEIKSDSKPDNAGDAIKSQYLSLKLDSLSRDAYRQVAQMTNIPGQMQPDGEGSAYHGRIDVKEIALEEHSGDSVIDIKLTSYPDYNAYILNNPDRLVVEIKNLTNSNSVARTDYTNALVRRLRPVYKNNLGILAFDLNRVSTLKEVIIDESGGTDISMKLVVVAADPEPISANESMSASPPAGHKKINDSNTVQKISKRKNITDKSQDPYSESIAAYQVGNITQAINLLYNLVREQPRHVEARTALAAILNEQGDSNSAKLLLVEGLRDVGDDISFIKTFAKILHDEGSSSEALELLARVSPAINSEQDFYALKAAILQQQENYRESNEIYGRLLGLNPDNNTWWAGYGITLEALGNQQEALRIYKRIKDDTGVSPDIIAYINQRLSLIN